MMGRVTPYFHELVLAANEGIGVLRSCQTDVLVYGTTPRPAGTTPPVITFSGSQNGRPYPILIACTLVGALGVWTGTVSYDGGATTEQAFTSAATVALTGKGAGLTLNIAAGNAALNNTWTATCATFSDVSGAGIPFGQPTATKQPIIAPGPGGFPEIRTDGAATTMFDALTLPAPGTTPLFRWTVFRQIAWTNNGVLWATGSSFRLQGGTTGTPSCFGFAGTVGPANTGAAVGSYVRSEEYFSHNAANDYVKLGSVTQGGTDLGNTGGSTSFIGSLGGATNFDQVAVVAFMDLNKLPSAGLLKSLSNAAVAKYTSAVGI